MLRLRYTPFLVALGSIIVAAASSRAPLARAADPPGLAAIFGVTSGAVRDTNGDGWPDAVAARVIVPSAPTAADIEAATNIAARLGFETTALTLPLVVREHEITAPNGVAMPILVGRDNTWVKKLADAGAIDLASLEPGQGLVAAVRAPLGGANGLVVAGADDEGVVAAGMELAARLPRLWSLSGITVPAIEEQTLRFLRGKSIDAASAVVTGLVVDRERRGIARIAVSAQVSPADVARAAKALQDLDLAHRRGLEPRTLNFANAAATVVTVVADGRPPAVATVSRSGLNSRTLTPPIDPDELAPDSPGARGAAVAGPALPAGRVFDLTNLYSIAGWLGDGYVDLIPDRTDTSIVLGASDDLIAATQIGARIGLETTGVTLPLTRRADKIREPAREPSPILVGRDNALLADLVKIGKVRTDALAAGEGLVQVVPRAFGNATATVVSGADRAGTEAAGAWLGRRAPYIWDNRRGAPSLDDVAGDVKKFLAAKSGAGQASQMLGELDAILADTRGKAIESVDVKVFVDEAGTPLDAFVEARVRAALAQAKDGVKGAKIAVVSQGVTDPVTVFEDKLPIPWEVDELRAKLKSDVLPKVRAGAKVEIDARVSESPELRKTLVDEIRAELVKAGAAASDVRVLSAYKQGFLWISEQVVPALKGKNAKSIRVFVARAEPDLSKKYKFYEVPTRWVHELYPIDEIIQRDLGIPVDNVHVELVDKPKDTYVVEALDGGGAVIHRAAFSPKTVEREYLEKFPGWSRVTVTTGWLLAKVDGATVVDARIATDPERFWDHYQAKVLPRLYDHTMKVTDNRPMPDKQPFHRDLDVEVWMSEPDFRIGFDEELISSLESLHEDLYFVTLDFYDALGRTAVRRRLAAPGKIFPIIHPERRGQPGEARILFAGNAATKPKIEVSYKEPGIEKPTKVTREITKIETTAPQVLRAIVTADRVREIGLSVDPKDDKEAGRAADAMDALARLQAAGLFRTALSYEHVGRVSLALVQKEARAERSIASTGAFAPSPIHAPAAKPAGPLVTWDRVISTEMSEDIVSKLSAYPEVHGYVAGKSYRGRNTSVLEITLPAGGEIVSNAKLTAYKPTIFITGRQHANEVSSTSHILRLAELLATDPAYKPILKRVNVILHPVENPDGAAMAYELQKLTPTHMLHAGRYSALGMDVGSQVGLEDPLLPESLVRMRVWRDWLPDIYLNPHGYPSHEWVQQFAGYVPPGFRSYWSSRGWYTSVSALRDPRYPEHGRAVDSIREAIVREINSNADVRSMNLRHQARYRRWAFGFMPYVFNQEIYKDTAIYHSDPESGQLSGSRRAGVGRGGGGGGRGSMTVWPQVTWFSAGTEAPDETAQGSWLDLVTKPGFSFLMASVRYLQNGDYKVERIEEDGQRDGATLTMFRQRPVTPGRTPPASTSTDAAGSR